MPIIIKKKLENRTVQEDEEVKLEVEISKPSLEVTWKKDHVALQPGGNMEIHVEGTKHSLSFKKISSTDQGYYSCETMDDKTRAKLTVENITVDFIKRLKTVEVKEGETCNFECVLSKYIKDDYVWTLNGQAVISDGHFQISNEKCRYKMSIKEVKTSDSGDVVFTIRNLSSRTMLFVKEKPVMVYRDMQSLRVTPGEDAELSCEITKRDAKIKWLKDGKRIKKSPKYEFIQIGNLVKLIIHEAMIRDSGEYCCKVDGTASRARLVVKDLEHIFSRGLRDTRAEEKGVAVLECETRRPSLRTTWLKGMAVLKPGGKYHMKQQGRVLSLTINHLEKSDGDVYTCDVGTARSSAALTIQGRKVVFIEELQDKKCLEGDTVVFKCCVFPSDFYNVRWYLDWTLLHNDHWSEIQVLPGGHHTLTMRNLARKDSGVITFEAGGKRTYAFLLVREKRPTITKALQDCEAFEGERLVLSCKTSKACHIMWYKDGCLIWNSSKYFTRRVHKEAILTIYKVTEKDRGLYECDAGPVSSKAQVVVKSHHSIPEAVEDIFIQSTGRAVFSSMITEHLTSQHPHAHDRSVMLLQSKPELLVAPTQHASLIVSKDQHDQTITSLSSESSSEYDKMDAWDELYEHSPEKGRKEEHNECSVLPERIMISDPSNEVTKHQEQTKQSRKAGCLEQCHKMLSSHQSETEDSTLGVNPIPTQGLITSTFYSRSQELSVRGVISDEAKKQSYQHLRSRLNKQLNEPLLEDSAEGERSQRSLRFGDEEDDDVPKDASDTNPEKSVKLAVETKMGSRSLHSLAADKTGMIEMTQSLMVQSLSEEVKAMTHVISAPGMDEELRYSPIPETRQPEHTFTLSCMQPAKKDLLQQSPLITKSQLSIPSSLEQSDRLQNISLDTREASQEILSPDPQKEEQGPFSLHRPLNITDVGFKKSKTDNQVAVSEEIDNPSVLEIKEGKKSEDREIVDKSGSTDTISCINDYWEMSTTIKLSYRKPSNKQLNEPFLEIREDSTEGRRSQRSGPSSCRTLAKSISCDSEVETPQFNTAKKYQWWSRSLDSHVRMIPGLTELRESREKSKMVDDFSTKEAFKGDEDDEVPQNASDTNPEKSVKVALEPKMGSRALQSLAADKTGMIEMTQSLMEQSLSEEVKAMTHVISAPGMGEELKYSPIPETRQAEHTFTLSCMQPAKKDLLQQSPLITKSQLFIPSSLERSDRLQNISLDTREASQEILSPDTQKEEQGPFSLHRPLSITDAGFKKSKTDNQVAVTIEIDKTSQLEIKEGKKSEDRKIVDKSGSTHTISYINDFREMSTTVQLSYMKPSNKQLNEPFLEIREDSTEGRRSQRSGPSSCRTLAKSISCDSKMVDDFSTKEAFKGDEDDEDDDEVPQNASDTNPGISKSVKLALEPEMESRSLHSLAADKTGMIEMTQSLMEQSLSEEVKAMTHVISAPGVDEELRYSPIPETRQAEHTFTLSCMQPAKKDLLQQNPLITKSQLSIPSSLEQSDRLQNISLDTREASQDILSPDPQKEEQGPFSLYRPLNITDVGFKKSKTDNQVAVSEEIDIPSVLEIKEGKKSEDREIVDKSESTHTIFCLNDFREMSTTVQLSYMKPSKKQLNEPFLEIREDSTEGRRSQRRGPSSCRTLAKSISCDSGLRTPQFNMAKKYQWWSRSLDSHIGMIPGLTELRKSEEKSTMVDDFSTKEAFKDDEEDEEDDEVPQNASDTNPEKSVKVAVEPEMGSRSLHSLAADKTGMIEMTQSLMEQSLSEEVKAMTHVISAPGMDEELRYSPNPETRQAEHTFTLSCMQPAKKDLLQQSPLITKSQLFIPSSLEQSDRLQNISLDAREASQEILSPDPQKEEQGPFSLHRPLNITDVSVEVENPSQIKEGKHSVKMGDKSGCTHNISDRNIFQEESTVPQISHMKPSSNLWRYPSQSELDTSPPTGKSEKSLLKKFFGKEPGTAGSALKKGGKKEPGHDFPSSLHPQQRAEDLSISKKLIESVSSFSKLLCRKYSKDKWEGNRSKEESPLPKGKLLGVGDARSHKRASTEFCKSPVSKKKKDIHIPLVPVDLLVVTNPGSDRSHQTYSFLSEINRGRFSVVWQCQDDWSKQLFAAKFTPYAQEQQQRVLGEYQLLKKLSHIHIVRLHSAFITPCYLVLIQELCAGRELLHNLAERDLYAEVHVSELLLQILSAVDYLHHRLIVHLDLKSENMLVTDHNLLKIVDLSSAQIFTPGQTLSVDHIQEMKAPEVLEKQGVGPETDIWAIGVLVFIMLSGDDPFQSELHWESRSNIKKGRIQFSRCYPGLSEGSVSFIKRTLNHKTWGRPSAAECLQLPWVKGLHRSSRHSDSIVCFSTDKLQAYLQEQETKREKVRTKMDMPLSN